MIAVALDLFLVRVALRLDLHLAWTVPERAFHPFPSAGLIRPMPTTIKTPRMSHVLIASPLLRHDGDRPRGVPLVACVLVTPLVRNDPQPFGVVPEDPWSGLTPIGLPNGVVNAPTRAAQGTSSHGGFA